MQQTVEECGWNETHQTVEEQGGMQQTLEEQEWAETQQTVEEQGGLRHIRQWRSRVE